MNDDGTMARLPDLLVFARKYGLKIITIADLIRYRRRNDAAFVEQPITKIASNAH
jgi:3,4-dihydroxy 2-butanone 4-phosphate synthase/GTP cyclohydrolase II